MIFPFPFPKVHLPLQNIVENILMILPAKMNIRRLHMRNIRHGNPWHIPRIYLKYNAIFQIYPTPLSIINIVFIQILYATCIAPLNNKKYYNSSTPIPKITVSQLNSNNKYTNCLLIMFPSLHMHQIYLFSSILWYNLLLLNNYNNYTPQSR